MCPSSPGSRILTDASDGSARFLQDIAVGDCFRTGSALVSVDAMRRFAASYDPQPMHLDSAAAEKTLFGTLIASGWFTLSMSMRLMVDSRPFGSTPIIGVQLNDIRFARPVVPGMRLHVEARVNEVRASARRSDRGYVSLQVKTFDENNLEVARQQWQLVLPVRE